MKKIQKAFSLVELSIVILIIGIVIAGVTSGSIMIKKMYLSTARTQTNSSPVSSIKDLAIWLETTSQESFSSSQQEDGQSITTWYDINPQKTAKLNVSQSTAGARPLFKEGIINNLPVLYFDGTDDNLDAGTSIVLNDITQKDQVTIFMVSKTTDGVSCRTQLMAASDTDLTNRIGLNVTCADNIILDFSPCCSAGVGRLINNSVSNQNYVNIPLVISYIVKNSTGTLRLNGSAFFNASALTGNFTEAQLNDSNAFLKIGGASEFFQGYIGEFILFRRGLKTEEIQDVEKYLAKKWGIRLS